MKKFFEVWQVIGFILVAIVLWPFLAPWIIILRAKIKKDMFMETKLGRNKWFRLVMGPWIVLTYIPALIIDLTVSYGICAYIYYKVRPDSFDSFMKLIDSGIDEALDSVKD